jgi:hypothetical protein
MVMLAEHYDFVIRGDPDRDTSGSSRRMTERATGTERFERVVFGSLSKVTRPRNWTAVDVTRMRKRSGSMSPITVTRG